VLVRCVRDGSARGAKGSRGTKERRRVGLCASRGRGGATGVGEGWQWEGCSGERWMGREATEVVWSVLGVVVSAQTEGDKGQQRRWRSIE
jgi:hypothetical protein